MEIGVSVRRGITACALTVPLIASPAIASETVQLQPWATSNTKIAGGYGLRACVDQAEEIRPQAWTCMGGSLTVTADRDGKTVNETTLVAEDFSVTHGALQAKSPVAGKAAPMATDYDTWCESGSICARRIGADNAIAEVKGNGAYGDSGGVIGSFDLVFRQSFNGKYPRWRSALIHDSGPEVQPVEFFNKCRINISGGPDGNCGSETLYFTDINRGKQWAWVPSSTAYRQNNNPLRNGQKYHDDHFGEFRAHGHSQYFSTGTLHTGRWDRCTADIGCRYYQVPWKP
ncbi:hypothetical protein ACFRK5_21430 [Streptomyces niveus]|uniref:hypothetical protein n=1 Tax=Streptomyces niveus TaxID=193462 RepID=UPI0036B0D97D